MLKKVIIKNFGPVKEEVVLSLEKGKTEQYPENVIENTNLLKSLYIYGSNNSGKSKIIETLKLLKDIVEEGKELFTKFSYRTYLLGKVEERKEVIKLDYYFLLENKEYRYSIELNPYKTKIKKENFYVDGTAIFIRDEIASIEENIFYLTHHYAKIGDNKDINNLVEYIKNIVYIDQQRESQDGIRTSSTNSLKKINYLENNLNKTNHLIKKFGFDFELTVAETNILDNRKYIASKRGEIEYPLSLFESFGTNVFIDLLLEIEQEKSSSQLIIIDEIERGIHFALVAAFINYINLKYPKKQLILPTHMTDLLESDINIRKDQVYISTITQDQGLKLEKKFNKRVIRETMNFQKIFKSKSVGGVPNISITEGNE